MTIKRMIYLLLQARRALGDFGMFIAIIMMVLFDHFLADTFTQVRKGFYFFVSYTGLNK